MDLGGIQGVFYDKRASLKAQSPVPDRLAGSAISTASATVPSTILVYPRLARVIWALSDATVNDRSDR